MSNEEQLSLICSVWRHTIENDLLTQKYLAQVLKRLPILKKLDGAPVETEERDAAVAAVATSAAGVQ